MIQPVEDLLYISILRPLSEHLRIVALNPVDSLHFPCNYERPLAL